MGIFSWLMPSNTKRATDLIEARLVQMKSAGIFDLDPKQSANQVMQYAISRLQSRGKIDIHPSVMAASWLTIFALEFRGSREDRLPFANVAIGLIQSALHYPGSRLSPADLDIAEFAFRELDTKFFNHVSINLDFASAAQPKRETIQIPAYPNSMLCIMAEYDYLNNLYGTNGEWSLTQQTTIEEDGRIFDKMDIVVKSQGAKIVWFDITDSRQHWTVEGNIAALASVGTDKTSAS